MVANVSAGDSLLSFGRKAAAVQKSRGPKKVNCPRHLCLFGRISPRPFSGFRVDWVKLSPALAPVGPRIFQGVFGPPGRPGKTVHGFPAPKRG